MSPLDRYAHWRHICSSASGLASPTICIESARRFDVVIVGAGPAGCVLAARLSECAAKNILLIEAGPDAPPGMEHPDIVSPFPVSAGNPRFHWQGLMAEIRAVRSANRSTEPYLQACGVGGASNINGMGADRGHPEDYDEWQALGATGWAWNDVLPYFKKLERDLDFARATPDLHGANGPIPVRRLPRLRWGPFAWAIASALERRGMRFLDDYNSDFREGFAAAPTNSLPEGRVSASMAYLTPAVRARQNVTILSNARVERVVFDRSRATGVFASFGDRTELIRGQEIILSCGAIQSPLLLMRSGIGPAPQLSSHGIDVVQHLPGVGQNLQNHPYIGLVTYLPRRSAQLPDNPWFLQNWARFSSRYPNCHSSDMHLIPFNRCAWHVLGARVGAIAVSVFKPYSRGCIELAGTDSTATPRIRFNLLDDPRDEERLVRGAAFALELLCDRTVAEVRNEVFLPDEELVAALDLRTAWNGCRAGAIAAVLNHGRLRRRLLQKRLIDPCRLLARDGDRRRFVLRYALPQFHVCGTCRMGRSDDPGAVVDSSARAQRVQGIRIVDASIFPTLPRANTHLTVIMVAEKIADAIKSEWRQGDGTRGHPM